jgi:hypothetical protein
MPVAPAAKLVLVLVLVVLVSATRDECRVVWVAEGVGNSIVGTKDIGDCDENGTVAASVKDAVGVAGEEAASASTTLNRHPSANKL